VPRPPVGGPGKPAQRRSLGTRGKRTMRKLLDAAVAVFAAKGYHAARVDDIVKKAGTSHGTFYLYFANKEDLFRALTEDVAGQMIQLVDALDHLEPGPVGRAALREWLDLFSEMYDHYRPVVRAWTEIETDGTKLGRVGDRMFRDLGSSLAGRIRDSSARDIDPEVASLALLAMVERFNYYVVSGQVTVDREEALDLLATILHDSLFGRAKAAAS
jgi:AcrR family transcriptional regulator